MMQRHEAPALHWHYQVEGDVTARGVLYIPASAPAKAASSPGGSRGVVSLCTRGVATVSNLHDHYHW